MDAVRREKTKKMTSTIVRGRPRLKITSAATISDAVGTNATAMTAAIDQRHRRDEKTTGMTTAMIAVRRKKAKMQCAWQHAQQKKKEEAALVAALMAPHSTQQRLLETNDEGRGSSRRGSVRWGKQRLVKTKKWKKPKKRKKARSYQLDVNLIFNFLHEPIKWFLRCSP